MRYLALATDYDGTLAHHGTVNEATLHALQRLRETGRKLLLVTGRRLPELQQDFDHLHLFDIAVVENGAVLYDPKTEKSTALADSPNQDLVKVLRESNVGFLSVGEVIIASHEPFEKMVLDAIHDLGLEYQVIFNKGAVMVLPTGINKATGLRAALAELALSRHNVVGVGDAENDHAFLDICGCSAAVANALPALRAKADLVTRHDHGAGVRELIERMMANDLANVTLRPQMAGIEVGTPVIGDHPVQLPPTDNLLVAGTSGGGKSTLVSGMAERAINRDFQTVVIDPEGDHAELKGTVVLGSPKQAPTVEEVAGAIAGPDKSVVANLVALRAEDQPYFLQRLVPFVHELRERTGRPHFLILDEAHHLLPQDGKIAGAPTSLELNGLLAATVEPHHVTVPFLKTVDHLMVTGSNPRRTIEKFCAATATNSPEAFADEPGRNEALYWHRGDNKVILLQVPPPRSARRRHVRKYAEGDLGSERSFVFKGPEGKHRLIAKNLQRFVELPEGVDDATWIFHLRNGDVSRWMEEQVKDPDLASTVASIEAEREPDPTASRERVRREIEKRYTASE